MDMSYQSPGAFFPYMSYPFGKYVTAPSPTPSVYSEPVYKISLPSANYANQGVQMCTPKMQSLNTAVLDARRRNDMNVTGTTPKDPTGINNFFQSGDTFSEVSESDASTIQGAAFSPFFSIPSIQGEYYPGCKIQPLFSIPSISVPSIFC